MQADVLEGKIDRTKKCRLGTVISSPIELLKCKAQASRVETLRYRTVMRNIINNEGVKGLFRGFWITFWRDLPSWAAYFWSYELLKSFGGLTEIEA